MVFDPASPFDTPRLMEELIAWLDAERAAGTLHPLLVIGVFVVVFLEIHPFQDGNGRLSRILTTLLLLQFGYAYVAYSSLERIVEERKASITGRCARPKARSGAGRRTGNPGWDSFSNRSTGRCGG